MEASSPAEPLAAGKTCMHDSPVPDNRTRCCMALRGVEQVATAPGGLR
jgi:hypothetical protein